MMKKGYEASSSQLIASSSYIKYDRLLEITNAAFVGSNATECNIFIDLYSTLHSLYNVKIYNELLDLSDYDIAACIINIIAHYRRFYWTRYKVKTKFFLIYSLNMPRASLLYYSNYNKAYANSIAVHGNIHDKITNNLALVEKIVPYITDANFTMTTFEVGTTIKHISTILNNSGDYSPNIVITKDIVSMQTISIPNTLIFRPKKSNTEDLSYFISATNNGIYNHLCLLRDNKMPFDSNTIDLNPSMYGSVLALTTCPERSINSLLATSTVLKQIVAAVLSNKLINGYNDIFSITNALENKTMTTAIHGGAIERFKAIDINYQYGILLNSPDYVSYTGLQNLYDPVGIHKLAAEYFNKSPLHLEDL